MCDNPECEFDNWFAVDNKKNLNDGPCEKLRKNWAATNTPPDPTALHLSRLFLIVQVYWYTLIQQLGLNFSNVTTILTDEPPKEFHVHRTS